MWDYNCLWCAQATSNRACAPNTFDDDGQLLSNPNAACYVTDDRCLPTYSNHTVHHTHNSTNTANMTTYQKAKIVAAREAHNFASGVRNLFQISTPNPNDPNKNYTTTQLCELRVCFQLFNQLIFMFSTSNDCRCMFLGREQMVMVCDSRVQCQDSLDILPGK